MVAYRFCRPDDIPFLVEAVEAAYRVHFPGEPSLSVKGFRREMKELDVWPSNSMVAVVRDAPVGVVVGTKREDEVLVARLGVRPDQQGEGHGSHLLTSLGQKLAVLGPPRLAVEVPESTGSLPFFEALGYRVETHLRDWLRPPGPRSEIPRGLVMSVDVPRARSTGLLDEIEGVAWIRRSRTVENAVERIESVAVVSAERAEAVALALEHPDGAVDLLRLAAAEEGGEAGKAVLAVACDAIAGRFPDRRLRLPRLSPSETDAPLLEALGFQPGPGYHRAVGEAKPA